MTQPGEGAAGAYGNLSGAHYSRTLLVSNSVFSKGELFAVTVLSLALCLAAFRDDVAVVNNFKLIGTSLHVSLLAWVLSRIFWGVKLESIFIVRALGLQTTKVYHSNFKSTKFIPWHLISDVVINEAIVMQRVIFYLAVLVRAGNNDRGELIIPIFTHARPRLAELKRIYTSVQLILGD